MKIFCVRIGNKYGPKYEDYINRKLKNYDVHWIREPLPNVDLQWNKMQVMGMDLDEPVVVIDIDILLTNDYEKLFDIPCYPWEFYMVPAWWGSQLKVNAGFMKYWPTYTREIYDTFMYDPLHWQTKYIKQGLTIGPVNGEQNFVYEHVMASPLDLTFPNYRWVGRISDDEDVNEEINRLYQQKTGNEYMYNGEDFHPDIKLVHFTGALNKPHNWSDYGKFV